MGGMQCIGRHAVHWEACSALGGMPCTSESYAWQVSDFGVSREAVEQMTMTQSAGTPLYPQAS